ncbi:MAG: hypothetical protein AB9866_18960 [Syntrophobacteraceae bacterium]
MKQQALVQLKEDARFYISTPERAAEALLFVRELERFASDIKQSIKERAAKIMDEKNMELLTYSITDPDTGEVREWEVRRDYGKQSKEYRPEKVVEAIGIEMATKYFKVSKVKLESYLKKASAKGEITMAQVTLATADPEIKTIKGSGVKLTEKKVTK